MRQCEANKAAIKKNKQGYHRLQQLHKVNLHTDLISRGPSHLLWIFLQTVDKQ